MFVFHLESLIVQFRMVKFFQLISQSIHWSEFAEIVRIEILNKKIYSKNKNEFGYYFSIHYISFCYK